MTEKKPHIKTAAILAAVPAFFTGLFLVLQRYRSFCVFVAEHIGRPYRNIAGLISSAMPYSVMEALYLIAIIFFVCFIIGSVIATVKSSRRILTAVTRVLALLAVILWIITLFLYSWAANYRTPGFSEKSGIRPDGCTKEELYTVADYFARRASSLSNEVPRNDKGVFTLPAPEIIEDYSVAYSRLTEEFPFLGGRVNKPKNMLFSKIMSATGFTGIYFSITGETNLNTDVPACFLPFTVAHELAHQKGFASEQECNFLGVAASESCGDVVYEYSGCLAGLLYTSNALYSADIEAWYDVMSQCSPGVISDLSDNNAYWAKWESPVEEAAESVYDSYLKSQGQELGIKSYGACVDLIVEYYINKAF